MKKTAIVSFMIIVFCGIGYGFQLQQEQKKLKFELTVPEAEIIIQALGKLPYEQAAPVIQSIVGQAQRQMQDTTKPKK